jgi:hypothetical protein
VLGLALAPSALAASWNSGYGWWTPGYGNRPVTVHASQYTYHCSVTAYGPTIDQFGYNDYAAGTSCAGNAPVIKTLTLLEQVLGPDHKTGFALQPVLMSGPSTHDPVRSPRLGKRSSGISTARSRTPTCGYLTATLVAA